VWKKGGIGMHGAGAIGLFSVRSFASGTRHPSAGAFLTTPLGHSFRMTGSGSKKYDYASHIFL
jgi:hypothetical protein